jgi:hypothetical protein
MFVSNADHAILYPPPLQPSYPDGPISFPQAKRQVREVTPWFVQRPTKPFAYPPEQGMRQ